MLMMRHLSGFLLLTGILLAMTQSAKAIREDECEQQRALYPKAWNDVAKDKALFKCQSRYSGPLLIRLGVADGQGRAVMSLVPLEPGRDQTQSADPERPIHRMWLDADQVRRLKEGQYFGTVVRTEKSCWIRGDLSGDPIFLMDNSNPKSDSPDASAFYNKAPRISSFKGDAYFCEAIK